MFSLKQLDFIVEHYPKEYTGCIATQDVVSGALVNNWTKEIFEKRDYLNEAYYKCGGMMHEMLFLSISSGETFLTVITSKDMKDGTLNPSYIKKDDFDISLYIKSKLDEYQFLDLDITAKYNKECTNTKYSTGLEHKMVLIKIDEIIYIVDSYTRCRSIEYRIFDLEQFKKMLSNAITTSEWNTFFRSKEEGDHLFDDKIIEIRV